MPKRIGQAKTAAFQFHDLPDKQIQWSDLLRKSRLVSMDFEESILRFFRFLLPILGEEVENTEWIPASRWIEKSP